MFVKEIRVKAIVEGVEGICPITVNAEVDRRICLDLMIESMRVIPGVVVYVPMHVVGSDDKVRPVDTESTVKALVENNIKVEGEIKMEKKFDITLAEAIGAKTGKVHLVEKASSDNEKTAFSALEEMLHKASETIIKEGGQSYIAKIMNAKDSDVYSEILTSLDGICFSTMKKAKGLFGKIDISKMKKADKVKDVQNDLEATTATVLEGSTDKTTTMAKVKALAVLVFKKVVALLKGILSFTFDTTTILAVAVGRVTYHTARELIFAGKAIGQAFNKDIIQEVKNA